MKKAPKPASPWPFAYGPLASQFMMEAHYTDGPLASREEKLAGCGRRFCSAFPKPDETEAVFRCPQKIFYENFSVI